MFTSLINTEIHPFTASSATCGYQPGRRGSIFRPGLLGL